MNERDVIINLTVGHLKECLKDLPEDMPIIIPVVDYDDVNHINGFRYVRTIGILSNEHEEDNRVLCLNGSANGLDISTQIYEHSSADTSTIVEKILF